MMCKNDAFYERLGGCILDQLICSPRQFMCRLLFPMKGGLCFLSLSLKKDKTQLNCYLDDSIQSMLPFVVSYLHCHPARIPPFRVVIFLLDWTRPSLLRRPHRAAKSHPRPSNLVWPIRPTRLVVVLVLLRPPSQRTRMSRRAPFFSRCHAVRIPLGYSC